MEAVGHKGIGYASIEAAVVGIVCLVIGGHVSGWVHDHKGYLDGLWCMISGLVVLQSLVSDTVKASKERIVGTLVASVLSALVCMVLGSVTSHACQPLVYSNTKQLRACPSTKTVCISVDSTGSLSTVLSVPKLYPTASAESVPGVRCLLVQRGWQVVADGAS